MTIIRSLCFTVGRFRQTLVKYIFPESLQCNEINWGHPTFFYQSQDEFRTKESEFVYFRPNTNEVKSDWEASSETQGQLVGAGKKSKTGEKKIRAKKSPKRQEEPLGTMF